MVPLLGAPNELEELQQCLQQTVQTALPASPRSCWRSPAFSPTPTPSTPEPEVNDASPHEATPETFYFDATAFDQADDMMTALDLGDSSDPVAFDSGLSGSPAAGNGFLPPPPLPGGGAAPPGRAAALFRALPFAGGGGAGGRTGAAVGPPRYARSASTTAAGRETVSMAVDRGLGAPLSRAAVPAGRQAPLASPPARTTAAAMAAATSVGVAARPMVSAAHPGARSVGPMAAASQTAAAARGGPLGTAAVVAPPRWTSPLTAGLAALLRGAGPAAVTDAYATAVVGLAAAAAAAAGSPPGSPGGGRAAWEENVRRVVRAAAAADGAPGSAAATAIMAGDHRLYGLTGTAGAVAAGAFVAVGAGGGSAPAPHPPTGGGGAPADAFRALLATPSVAEAGADALAAALADDVVGTLLTRAGVAVRVAAAASATAAAVGPALARRAGGGGRLVSAG